MQRRIGIIRCSPIMMGKAFWLFYIMILIRNIIELLEVALRGETQIANLFSYAMFAYAVFAIIAYSNNQNRLKTVSSLACIVAFFELSAALFKNNSVYIQDSIQNVLLTCFPHFAIALGISDYDDLEERMERYFPVYIILSWLLIILAYSGLVIMKSNDYMKIAYDIMIPIGISGYLATKYRDVRHYALFIVSAVALLFIGCRGAFAAVAIAFLISLFRVEENKKMRWITTIVAVLIFIFFNEILEFASYILGLIGYDSRIITRISQGSLFQSTGRDLIRLRIMEYAQNQGFRMFGIFGDRYLGGITMNNETYLHNIVLEFVIDYGIFLGIVLLVVMAFMIIRHWKKSSHSELVILSLFTTMTLVKLMLSNSYLVDSLFYSFLGLQFSAGYLQKIRRIQQAQGGTE